MHPFEEAVLRPQLGGDEDENDERQGPLPESLGFLAKLDRAVKRTLEGVVVVKGLSVKRWPVDEHVMALLPGFFESPSTGPGPFDGVAPDGVGAGVPNGGGVLIDFEFVSGVLPIGIGPGVKGAINFVDTDDVLLIGADRRGQLGPERQEANQDERAEENEEFFARRPGPKPDTTKSQHAKAKER